MKTIYKIKIKNDTTISLISSYSNANLFGSIKSLIINNTTVYAAADNGIFKSSIDSNNWSSINDTLTVNNTVTIFNDTLYVGNYNGIFFYDSTNSIWKSTSVTQPILSFGKNNSMLLAGTASNSIYQYYAKTWSLTNHQPNSNISNIYSILINDTLIYIGGDDGVEANISSINHPIDSLGNLKVITYDSIQNNTVQINNIFNATEYVWILSNNISKNIHDTITTTPILLISSIAPGIDTIKVYGHNSWGNSDTIIIIYNISTGIYEYLPKTAINIYPNPATDFVTITSSNTNSTYDIFNMTGALLEHGNVQNNVKINVKNLVPGTYCVKVDNIAKLLVVQ